jgi:hypothetical protein
MMAQFKLPTRLRAQGRSFLFWAREPLLVVQVQDTVTAVSNPGTPGFGKTHSVEAWRDATVEDLK